MTPDGRYVVVRGRLWRAVNPDLPVERRAELVAALMTARREVRAAQGDTQATRIARDAVDRAKRALGERGPTWWTDAPDFNRYLVRNTPYAAWFASHAASEAGSGEVAS